MKRRKRADAWAMAGLSVAFWAAACGGSKTAGGDDNGEEPCRLNSDCARGEVCEEKICIPECMENRDCVGDHMCAQGWGCQPPDFEPPLETPPRDLQFDPGRDVSITFEGCELDMDCAAGSGCVGGTCETVLAGPACEWRHDQPMRIARVLSISGVGLSLAHDRGTHLACINAFDGTNSSLYLAQYMPGELKTSRLKITDFDSQDSISCPGVATDDGQYIAVVGINDLWASYSVSADGDVVASSDITDFGSQAFAYDTGRLVPGYLGAFIFSWTHAGLSYVATGQPGTNWSLRLSQTGLEPSAAAVGATSAMTTRSLGGILLDEGNVDRFDELALGRAGLGLHPIGASEYGWFSFDSSGRIHYGVGDLKGSWESIDTGLSDAPVFGPAGVARSVVVGNVVRSDVAFHAASSTPLLAYMGDDGSVRYVTRHDGNWVMGSTPLIDAYDSAFDLRALWVGCGRPAVEVLPHAVSHSAWYFLEAR